MIPFPRRRTEADFLDVGHEGAPLRIRLRRQPNARRMTLRVSSATGDVSLTVPRRSSMSAIRSFADKHRDWIATRLEAVPRRQPFVDGALVPLRGDLHRIACRPGRSVTRAVGDAERTIAVCCEPSHVARRVRDYLTDQARRDLIAATDRYASAVGATPNRITLRDTRSRWGSCTASGSLNFSWRLIMAPPLVLDYLVAHEMTHLRELNHSHRFWTLLRSICPHVDEAELWLKRQGSDLHRYG